MTNMDKLYEAVEARGPVCVGLDTDFSYLPEDFVDSTLTKGENIVRFNKKLIDATKAVAGCYKVQIAYYESLGLEGLKAVGADSLGSGNAVMQPDDGLTAVAGAVAERGLLGAVQVAPAATGEQEQQQEHEHEHALTAPAAVMALILAQGQQAGKVHALVTLHEGQQTSDITHGRVLLVEVVVHLVFKTVHLTREVRRVVAHEKTSKVSPAAGLRPGFGGILPYTNSSASGTARPGPMMSLALPQRRSQSSRASRE